MTNLKKNWVSNALLLCILLVGLYLRIQGIITNSFAFTYDVGRDMLAVQNIVVYHKIPLIGQTTGLGGLFYGPWWYYILTPPFVFFGGSPQGIGFFMVFIGILVILTGFILGKIIEGKVLGIILALLISVSSVMVGFSNQIWNPNIAPLFVVLLFICLFLLQRAKKRKFLLYSAVGFLLGLILDAEIVFGVLFVSGFVLVIMYVFRKKIWNLAALGIPFGFLVILSPRIFFELRHQFVMSRSLFAMHTGDQQIFDLPGFFTALPDRFMTLLGQFKDTFGLQSDVIAISAAFCIMFIFFFFRKKLKKPELQLVLSSLIILCVFLVGSAFFARAVWGHYLVGLPVLYLFIVSVFFLLLYRWSKTASVIMLIIFAIISIRPIEIVTSFGKPLWEGNAAVYRNQVAVIDYIYKDADGKKFNYIAYTPVVHDYTYQYLFSWYGEKKYHMIPAVNKADVFYVIIEPDPGYPGRIKDWLKVREHDGKVIKEKVVKGGITVQTRIH